MATVRDVSNPGPLDPQYAVDPGYEYEYVAASQTGAVLGANGRKGDYLEGLVCVVATAATAQVQLIDGAGSARTILPNSPGGGIGTYRIQLGIKSMEGGWSLNTGAGVTVYATGNFT